MEAGDMPNGLSEGGTGRSIELSVAVPGTPEEVWRAIATGPGITSWFVSTEVVEREGGTVRQSFGELGSDEGRVLVWEPPRRVRFEGGASSGQPLEFDWVVEEEGDAHCRVRLVATGFGEGAEWDAEVEGMSLGWPLFLENLRLHLTHFPSQRATPSIPVVPMEGSHQRAWADLCAALGVPDGAGRGDSISFRGLDGRSWEGRVERCVATEGMRNCAVLLEEPPATGFLAAEGTGDQVMLMAHLWFYGDDAEQLARRWDAEVPRRLSSNA